jgi:3-methyl-2-oxobutanoate hydroxymethyltransferase
MVGMYDNFTPKFVKKYANIGETLEEAFREYCSDVKNGVFPEDDTHSYRISDEEKNRFLELISNT